ncbi:putative nuclease HARBI1 [Photinus pyralis]|uniref:putative nuclease HARBI1 n=1 Tax=Photinus pyralis TaxID=7054 RepID=UPI00126781BE|nr:putative nuclease HARBI1 [Photinus pyralis]
MSNTAEEQNLAISGFYQIAGFPGVLGAIDCTHIKIQSPGGEYAERFRNRKGYFSVNVQAVCNAKLKIQNIIARWPGSVHDSTIFNDSALKVDFESGLYGNGYLLGDNGYPCKRYILTPYLNPASPSQRAYNRAQIATRNPVERLFGVIKRRFPCLSIGFRCRLERALAIVVACCVLHNIAIAQGDIIEDFNVDLPEELEAPIVDVDDDSSVRTALVNTVFAV